MITAHRTHRHFNIDRYLDEQLAQQSEERRLKTDEYFAGLHRERAGLHRERCLPNGLQVAPQPQFRGWAVRLNARIERWMDSTDWMRIDIWLGNLCGFALTGFVVYLLWTLADAWVQGRFNLGAN